MFKTGFITVQNNQLSNYGKIFKLDLCIICTLLGAVG